MNKTSPWLVAALAAALVAALIAFGACTKPGSSDSTKLQELEKRIEKLEAAQKGYDEIAEFVRPIMQQQPQEPDPTVRFAVTVEGNEYDGPATAAVTVVEAWDFA